jgi:hypothetical protein
MGKKKDDHEASSSRVKKDENPRMRVPLLIRVARVLYEISQPCDG